MFFDLAGQNKMWKDPGQVSIGNTARHYRKMTKADFRIRILFRGVCRRGLDVPGSEKKKI